MPPPPPRMAIQLSDSGTPSGPTAPSIVRRLTRFTTQVPAHVIVERIEAILSADTWTLPEAYRHMKQTVHHEPSEFRLRVWWGGMYIGTVQVYLARTAVYLVEFIRGDLDAFSFQRFYAAVRDPLSDVIKRDYSLQMMGAM